MTEFITVVFAEDHPVFRSGLSRLLELHEDIRMVGETDNGYMVVDLVFRLKPDILLLDLQLPGICGLDIAREIHNSKCHTRILALSAFDYKFYVDKLIQYGAVGYLLKN